MKIRSASFAFMLMLSCAGLLPCAFAQAAPPAATKAQKAAAAETTPASAKISYDDLHKYIGDRITVHTKFQTTRTGVLSKVTKSELTLNIDTANGPTQMTIPKDTVADAVAVPAPAQH